MQSLAVGVGDLKRVLTNVKTRGDVGRGAARRAARRRAHAAAVRGERRDGAAAATSASSTRSACRAASEDGAPCWLPIDAKFPLERLAAAAGRAGARRPAGRRATPARRSPISCAARRGRSRRQVRRVAAHDRLRGPVPAARGPVRRDDGAAGPRRPAAARPPRDARPDRTTSSRCSTVVQMGFRTLAIEQRSSEVWRMLGAVKTEFTKFGEVLAKTKERIDRASDELAKAGVRTRALERAPARRRRAPRARGREDVRARRSTSISSSRPRTSNATCSTAIRRWREQRVLRTARAARRAVARGARGAAVPRDLHRGRARAAARQGRAVPAREGHRRRARPRRDAAASARSSRCRPACWC